MTIHQHTDDERTCARCDDAAVDGSRFCSDHGPLATDGGVVTAWFESWDDLDHGDQITYVGPGDLPDDYATPLDRELPYTFQHVSAGGTLSCLTRFTGRKRLAPEHPANDPAHWEVVDE